MSNPHTASDYRTNERFSASADAGRRIAEGMQVARLKQDGEIPAPKVAMVANVIGPWLCALASLMVRKAVEKGLTRLYFLSRDAEILQRIAQRIAPAELECRYLYSSRRAWCFPAMLSDDPASLSWLQTWSGSPSSLLRSLCFDEEERNQIRTELGQSEEEFSQRLPSQQLEPLWQHLRKRKYLEKALARAREARIPTLAYLKQEGLLADDQWAVCDVGWSLNSQAALGRLLRCESPEAEARGIYFMVTQNRVSRSESGPFDSWLVEETAGSQPEEMGWKIRALSGMIEEFFLTNAAPSLKGYRVDPEGRSHPVFVEDSTPAMTRLHAEELRLVTDRLVSEWEDHLTDDTFAANLQDYALKEMMRFFRSPGAAEAALILPIYHASEAAGGQKDSSALVRPYTFRDSARILLRRAGMRKDHSRDTAAPLWHEGSMAVTPRLKKTSMKLSTAPKPWKFWSLNGPAAI